VIPGDIPLPIVLTWLFVFGAVIGSFLNVCIYRIPQHERLWDQLSGLNHPPSSCPFCKKRILAIDNIPVLGWIILAGRCRFCRHLIPIRYALIEFFNGLLWVVLYIAIVPAGFSAKVESSALYSPLGALGQQGLSQSALVWLVNAEYLYFLILAEALLVATFIDFDLMIIPDGVTIPGMILGVAGACILGAPTLWPVWFFSAFQLNVLNSMLPEGLLWLVNLPEQIPWMNAHPHWHGLISSLMGLVIGGASVWLIRIAGHWVFQREAMGFGDVVLMAMIGSFLGWQASLLVFLLVGPLCALVATAITFTMRSTREIPFGPYLSVGALVVVLFWNPYFSKFENFFSYGPLLPIVFLSMGGLFVPLLVLLRFVKHRLGFRDEPMEYEEWTSADQLSFFANQEEKEIRPPLQPKGWPGISAGQGTSHTNRWRGTNN
jgi:leader peptidase (prepilin peptidase)/N-methyltransferase